MKTLIKISWRNVWRNKTRSFVIILAITFGLWGAIFATSIFTAMIDQQFESSIRNQVSHIQIHNPDFLKDRMTSQMISQSEEIAQFLHSLPELEAFSPRILASGMIASAALTAGVEIFGVDPEMEDATRGFRKNIRDGEYLDADMRNPVLVGNSLAEKLKIEPGNRVVLTFQDITGDITSAAFRVSGIYRTANSSLDERLIYIRKQDMAAILGSDGVVNEIAILLNDLETVSPVKATLESRFPEYTIRSWAEVSPELSFMNRMSGVVMMVLVIIILFALAFGLLNTMLMTIFERTRELGVLMSVGMNKARVFSMILLETSFLTISGSVGGILVGLATLSFFSSKGIDFSSFGAESLSEFGIDAIICPSLGPEFFVNLVILVILTAVLSALYPAYKALKLNPAEAVRKD